MATTQQATEPEAQHRTFFGHPWGLANLFGLEVWERFSFYGMQAILTYYLYFTVRHGGLGFRRAVPRAWSERTNTTALLGALYSQGDTRRDAGFSIFYMGINIGALAGPL